MINKKKFSKIKVVEFPYNICNVKLNENKKPTPLIFIKIKIKIKDFLNQLDIGKKLILIYSISCLLPLIICGFFFSFMIGELIQKREIVQAERNITRLETIYTDIFKKITDVANRTYVNSSIGKFVTTEFESSLELYDYYANFTFFDDYLRSYNEIENIRFFINNPTILNNSFFVRVEPETEEAYWYKNAIENEGRIIFDFRYDEVSRRNHIALIRQIRSSTGEHWGVLCINIRMESLGRWLADETFETFLALNGELVLLIG